MSNRTDKPKKSAAQLIVDMRDIRGITFVNIDESQAEQYLAETNNYLRTAAFRNNYEKYQKGKNQGKYIDLDFSYLQELSTIDMHYRFLVEKMCSDIEHGMCVRLIRDIELDPTTDGYDVVKQFLSKNSYIIKKIEGTILSPHTGELIRKYFTVIQKTKPNGKSYSSITAYDDCPAWVLVEILSFGSLAKFYEFYYKSRGIHCISSAIINMVKSLRNAAAHNNCILYNLRPNISTTQKDLSNFVINKVPSISKSQRRKRMTSRPILEFVALIFMYDSIVVGKIRDHRINEIRELFEERMLKNKEYFRQNKMIIESYKFAYEVVRSVLL